MRSIVIAAVTILCAWIIAYNVNATNAEAVITALLLLIYFS